MILLGLIFFMESSSLHIFPKSQHLTGTTVIADLFSGGKSFLVFPVRVVWKRVPKEDEPVKLLMSVPKKRFKHAVDRNRYKRLLREAYRLNNTHLLEVMATKEYSLHVAFTVVGTEIPTFAELDWVMTKILEKMEVRLS